jgi:hypothetical protein
MKQNKFCEIQPWVHIFFVTYQWAQEARVLQYTRLERQAKGKHSSLLGPIVSYEVDEVLQISAHCLYFLCNL